MWFKRIKYTFIRYLLWAMLFSWLFFMWNLTYAADNTKINTNNTKPIKTEIKFWKIFQLFINDPDVQNSTWKEQDVKTCNYLNENPLKKSSLGWFWDILYFILIKFVLTWWLITFIFYKMMDIYNDIKWEKITPENTTQGGTEKKDLINSLLESILNHWKSIFAIIIFYIVVLIIINSFTLKCY